MSLILCLTSSQILLNRKQYIAKKFGVKYHEIDSEIAQRLKARGLTYKVNLMILNSEFDTVYIEDCPPAFVMPYLMYLGYMPEHIINWTATKTVPIDSEVRSAKSFDGELWLEHNKARYEKWLKGVKK